jgi:hypothetical protein
MNKIKIFISGAFLAVSLAVFAKSPVDYLNVEKVKFDGKNFSLAWSSHPNDVYYLQEYLPKGENFDNFVEMFSVCIHLYDNISAAAAVEAKIKELEKRSETDKCCHYKVYNKDDEYILDFLVSEGNGETLSVVESNVHRYKVIEIDGKKALQLIFYSHRAYGDDILPYLGKLAEIKKKWIVEMTQMNINCEISK